MWPSDTIAVCLVVLVVVGVVFRLCHGVDVDLRLGLEQFNVNINDSVGIRQTPDHPFRRRLVAPELV